MTRWFQVTIANCVCHHCPLQTISDRMFLNNVHFKWYWSLSEVIKGSHIGGIFKKRSFKGHLRFLDFLIFKILKVNMEAFCIMVLNYIWLWVNKNAERGQTYKSVKLIIRFSTVQTTNQTRSYWNAKQHFSQKTIIFNQNQITNFNFCQDIH